MEFLRPTTWANALAARAEHPQARPIAGGTDVMVEMNFDRTRPPALLDLTAVSELATWARCGERLRIGAAVPYSRIIRELGDVLPGLAIASRAVGSPQIRNRGTVGGNLASASPAGDAHPPLLAGDATVEVESVRGVRMVPIMEFFVRPKVSALQVDELIRAVWVAPADGPQQFAKVGARNAMVIAVCSFALALHPSVRKVGTGIGSAAPTPLRACAAEEFVSAELDWQARRPLDQRVIQRFGELVAASASPIDDARGTVSYRRHALAVMARRLLAWSWYDYCKGDW